MQRNLFIALITLALVIFPGCYSTSVSNHTDVNPTDAVRVLFIGNSLTDFNNLPGMVADIAESHGHTIIYDSYTPGGARLVQHASNIDVLKKFMEQPWTFVVLQEQSQFPGFSYEQLSTDVFPYAKRLSEAIKKANSETSVVFYMAMARRNGDPDNAHISSELLTYEGMQKRVNNAYLEMAKQNKALIAPVGEVWRRVRQQNPDIDLYSDDVHPNVMGTYLAAAVFYATFFQSPSLGSAVPDSIDSKTAGYLQSAVDAVVLGAEEKWNWRLSSQATVIGVESPGV